MKTKTTIWEKRQRTQLEEITKTARKYVRQEFDGHASHPAEDAVIRLQRAFPTAFPYLLFEAAYYAVENSSMATEEEKQRGSFQRAKCKIARLKIYEELNLTFNV